MNNTVHLKEYFESYFNQFLRQSEESCGNTSAGNTPQGWFVQAIHAILNDDAENSIRLLTRAAEGGHAQAAYGLGVCLAAVGEGGSSTLHEAVEWLNFAAELGEVQAMVALGFLYLAEDSPLHDEVISAQWFGRAAEKGDSEGMYEYGSCYLAGRGVEQDFARSAYWFARAAELGCPLSQFELGVQYCEGEGVPENVSKAMELFEKAAAQEHPGAMAALADLYYSGRGVEQDYSKAYSLFLKCYLKGNPKGNLGLARFYLDGEVVPCDIQTALRLLSTDVATQFPAAQALKQNLIENLSEGMEKREVAACVQLGWAVLNGYAGDGNRALAYGLLTAAAVRQDPLARCLLRCYFSEQEQDCAADVEECRRYFRQLMEIGCSWAARELLLMALRGDFEATEDEIQQLIGKGLELGDLTIRELLIRQAAEAGEDVEN